MELPRRPRGDELLRPGEMTGLRERLRLIAKRRDLKTVIAYSFDFRTRILPFIYADLRMAPAGVRAIGSALADAGFPKTRIVLQQWNPNFRPSGMRLDGGLPDLFLISSLQLHSAECMKLIRDACRIEPARRPLVVVGGPKTIYEPWAVFPVDPADPAAPDLAVTGEEFVFLSLLEVLLSNWGTNETLRSAFLRARDEGLLDSVPGLVYRAGEELVDTGIQRLLGNLDELPHPAHGFRLLEAPSRGPTLAGRALPADRVFEHSPIGALVMTFGCKFSCKYCPIPAYNQRQHRLKSGARIEDEMVRVRDEFGIRHFFGADDNFFNNRERTLDIIRTLGAGPVQKPHPRGRIRWGTEATVHDTVAMREHLREVRRAGVRALWIGVEDMTATLVKKGQSVDNTTEAFRLLREHGIMPMPMMMHHDSQPLWTPGKPYGLLNQVHRLRQAGAATLQVTMLSPATGSKLYEETFTSGLAYESAGGRKVEHYMLDSNYVIASRHPKPWLKQLNIMLAYLFFYNPVRLLISLFRSKTSLWLADGFLQVVGMWAVARTICRTFGWMMRLMRGRIVRTSRVPGSRVPMRSPNGGPAGHALPGGVALRWKEPAGAAR
ncbi:MAG: radical SAM protein [Planctomycetes bacterium]|nr:radical SAM protein [Planctomycetota bacterium]